jgi:hypothetical protein
MAFFNTSTNQSLTPEKVQQILDENQQFILAILENQNIGRLQDCVQYQKKLHQNLILLATLADSWNTIGSNLVVSYLSVVFETRSQATD